MFLTCQLMLASAHAQPYGGVATAESAVEAFVTAETRQYGDAVRISVGQSGTTAQFPPCVRLDVFLPAGTRLWGKTSVGVKCSEPTAWTAFVPVNVSVSGSYLLTARRVNRGQTLTESDITLMTGDLTTLPAGALTEARLAVGQRVKNALAARQVLTREQLFQPPVIRQGDKVRVVARGGSFFAASDGVALNNAAEGEPVKVRAGNGRTLSGTARLRGEVELAQ